jgi:hypothetical protein
MSSEKQKSSSIPELRYPPMDAATALEASRRDLRVAERETAEVGPGASETNCFHLVWVREYSDLQTLDLVPPDLEHERVREAITADDADAYDLARDRFRRGQRSGECSCAEGPFGFRTTYNRLRRLHHPNLARVLSDHFGQQIAWDDLLARVVRAWHSRLVDLRAPLLVGLLALNDIDIGAHATLRVLRTVDILSAHDIRIGDEGRLDFQGGGVKVRCASLTGPHALWDRPVDIAAAAKAVNRATDGITP